MKVELKSMKMNQTELCDWLDQQRRVCECTDDGGELEMLWKQMQGKHAGGS